MSVQPEHAENVLDGLKTYEIRKILPSCSFPYILYIYETKKIYRTRQGIKFPGAGAVVGYAIIGAHIRTNVFNPEVEKFHFRGPAISITIRSTPGAIPACGGAP